MSLIPWRGKQHEAAAGETSPIGALRTEIDRLFDSLIREPLGNVDWPFAGEGRWAPAVDVGESEDEVTVRAEVPGIDPDDLSVTLTGSQLVLSGEKKETALEKGKEVHQRESRWGSFRRAVTLPEEVDRESVDAACADGVLVIRLKKIKPTTPKRIEVKGGPTITTRTSPPPPSPGD
jgi:HSP20 family protein